MLDAGGWTLAAGCWREDAGGWRVDAGTRKWRVDAGCCRVNARKLLEGRYWGMLGDGCLKVDAGG